MSAPHSLARAFGRRSYRTSIPRWADGAGLPSSRKAFKSPLARAGKPKPPPKPLEDDSKLSPSQIYVKYNTENSSKYDYLPELTFAYTHHDPIFQPSSKIQTKLLDPLSDLLAKEQSSLSPSGIDAAPVDTDPQPSSSPESESSALLRLSFTATRNIIKEWEPIKHHWLPLPLGAHHPRLERTILGLVTAPDFIRLYKKDPGCLKRAVGDLKEHWTKQRELVEDKSRVQDDTDRLQVILCLVGWGPIKIRERDDTNSTVWRELEKALLKVSMEEGCLITEVKGIQATVETIYSLLGDIARRPYHRSKKGSQWFVSDQKAFSKGTSAKEIYPLMLQQIPYIHSKLAASVQTAFPSLRELMEELEEKGKLTIEDEELKGSKRIIRTLLSTNPHTELD